MPSTLGRSEDQKVRAFSHLTRVNETYTPFSVKIVAQCVTFVKDNPCNTQ